MAGNDKPHAGQPRFADLVGKVRRLEHDTVEFEPSRPPPRRRAAARAEDGAVDTFGAFEAAHDDPEFQRNGVQTSVMRKLRRGQFPVEDEVDLHGLTSDAARQHLQAFLNFAGRDRVSCVRVIHGKGLSSPNRKAVLRPRVRHWLREDPRVLAFAPAAPRDGGSGALYVLLRSRS